MSAQCHFQKKMVFKKYRLVIFIIKDTELLYTLIFDSKSDILNKNRLLNIKL